MVIVLRPAPGLDETLARLANAGIAAIAAPLFRIAPVAWDVPDADGFDALLIGSANAIRHGGAGLAQLRALPVVAVGSATADAARKAGFAIRHIGSGDLQSTLDQLVPGQPSMRLLRLAGAAHVPLHLPQGFTIDSRIAYAAKPLPLAADAIAQLPGSIVMLHSGEAARQFSNSVDRLRLDRSTITLAALAPRIAAAAGDGWRAVVTAPAADDAALVALVGKLCQKPD